jgi:preprotein translocase subunit SecD
MEKKQVWRRFFLVVLAVFTLAYTVPTFVGSTPLPEWYTSLFSKKLQFGLDLQGGLELRYTVDYKKAIKDNTNRLRESLIRAVAEQVAENEGKKPLEMTREELAPYRDGISTEMVSFSSFHMLFDESAKAKMDLIDTDFMERYTSGYLVQGAGATQVLIFMSETQVQEVRNNVVAETLSIIRKRVDAFGLVEPDVRKSGDTDIDVQLPGVGQDQMDEVRKRIGQTAQLTFRIVDQTNWFGQHRNKVSEYKATKPKTTIAYDERSNAFTARSKAELVDFVKT